MSSLTRGPLSAGVYWRRRLLALVVLSVVLGLPLATLRLTGDAAGPSGSTPTGGTAAPVAQEDEPTPPTAAEQERARQRAERRAERRAQRSAERAAREAAAAPLAEPEGRCSDADVVVRPVVEGAVAGSEVTLLLNLRAVATPACTWQVGPAHLTVKITSGEDDVWSGQQCPGALPRQRVTVRAEATSTVALTWDARRSAAGCPATTTFAEPGYYHVVAASLGGEPSDVQFELVDPRVVAERARSRRRT